MTKIIAAILLLASATVADAQGIYMGRDGRAHAQVIVGADGAAFPVAPTFCTPGFGPCPVVLGPPIGPYGPMVPPPPPTAYAPIAPPAEPQQTRIYDSRGNSLGTSVPQGQGSTRYYDSRGNSLGTSTTTGNTTNYYDPRGNRIGSSTTPKPR
jgi:YD repeat-containing protein